MTARDKLLRSAAELFYRDGVTATGIDAVTERAGVAQQSLYNNFKSKADLVSSYLTERHAEWLDLYAQRLAIASNPISRILAVFDAYHDHAKLAYESGFRGCGLLNAAAEFPSGDAGRLAVREHKEEVEQILVEHLSALLPDDPTKGAMVARHLSYLLEGAMSRAGLEGESQRLIEARTIAHDILRAL